MTAYTTTRAAIFLFCGLAEIFTVRLALADVQRPCVETRCPGEHFDIAFVRGGKSPYIELTAAGRRGLFLLDYGTTRSSLARRAFLPGSTPFDAAARSDIDIDDFSLPTFSSGRFWLLDYRRLEEPRGGQLGIIGTDFLSLLNADFSFHDGHGDVVLSAAPCSHAELRARGLIPVRQRGFFSRDVQTLSAAMPNVPVLFVNIGGVFAFAQIDTGYDDRVSPPSIDINDALYDKLVAAGVALHREGVSTIAGCHGIVTNDIYSAPAGDVSLRTEEDREIRSVAGAMLIRKKSNGCGGIGDMAEPAAQLGMSVVARLGSIVFDTRAGLVWVPGSR